MRKTIDEYPLVLTGKEISEIMKCSLPTAYKLMDQPDFPSLKVNKFRWVGRDAFFAWLNSFSKLGGGEN